MTRWWASRLPRRARPASAMMACAAWKSSAVISGSWAMVSDQTQLLAWFQRIRVS